MRITRLDTAFLLIVSVTCIHLVSATDKRSVPGDSESTDIWNHSYFGINFKN